MARRAARTSSSAKKRKRVSGTQRALLSALLVLLTVAGLYALTVYVERHPATCQQQVAGGYKYILCYEFDFYPGLTAMELEDFLFASRLALGPIGVLLAALLFYPQILTIVETLRNRWRTVYTSVALATVCIGIGAFIFYFGNQQFGGFDFSILLEHGWRLVQGQVPYRDFVCTLPPGFFLGIKWAFLIFGVRWNAVLWITTLFTAATFLWIYALLRKTLENPIAAFLTALSVETTANLVLCYWGYNNVTNVTATVFFLSCLAYLQDPEDRWTQVSYTASLALLGLMKPNIAGLTGMAGVLALFTAAPRRIRLLLLTVGAVAANLLLLTANHVSVPGLLDSYRELARGRSGALLIGIAAMLPEAKIHTSFFLPFLLLPFWTWPARMLAVVREKSRKGIAFYLLLIAAPTICIAGMLTNGELKDVEWPMLICAGVILLQAPLSSIPQALDYSRTTRIYACCLGALMAADIYMGVERYRVRAIGEYAFFVWNESVGADNRPYFADMRASNRFWRVLDQIEKVKKLYPGPIYLGPRLEFVYSVFRIPSPLHLAPWWDPSTAFSYERVPAMEAAWRADKFRTVIFLRGDTTFYSRDFISELAARYEYDLRWPELTVFHSETPGGSPKSAASK